jgi:hypothetical protein
MQTSWAIDPPARRKLMMESIYSSNSSRVFVQKSLARTIMRQKANSKLNQHSYLGDQSSSINRESNLKMPVQDLNYSISRSYKPTHRENDYQTEL